MAADETRIEFTGRVLRATGVLIASFAAIGVLALMSLGGCDAGPQSGSSSSTRIDSDLMEERLQSLRGLPLGEAYRTALDERDSFVRHMLLASVYARIDESDFAEIRQAFEADLGNRSAIDARVFGNLWARIDSTSALGEVLVWPSPRARKFASDEILNVMVKRSESEAAIQAMRDLPDEVPTGVRQLAELSLAEALARNLQLDPLLALLVEQDDVAHQNRAMTSALIEITRVDRDGYPRWVETLKDDDSIPAELRNELVMQAIRLLAKQDIQRAIDWYPTIANDVYASGALTALAKSWGHEDPAAAVKWLRARPESEGPGPARRAAAYLWLKLDAATAKAELRQAVEEDPGMIMALLPLVQYLMISDLEESMELAQRIPDPEEKESALKKGLMRWARLDPDAVDRYLATHEVSADVRRGVRLAKSLKAKRTPKPDAS